MRGYLLIHGLENHRPDGHWMRILASRLRIHGHYVAYPQLPNPDFPEADAWLEVLGTEIDLMHEIGVTEVVVIAHSLGCVAWLKFISNQKSSVIVERVLLVAPADPELLYKAPSFQDVFASDIKEIFKKHAKSVKVIAGDLDPWLPKGIDLTFGQPLNIEPIIWPQAGHISMDEGFGNWDGVFYWALDPSNDLLIR